MVAEAGLDLHFRPWRKYQLQPVFELVAADVHWTSASKSVRVLLHSKKEKKKVIPLGMTLPFLVAEGGLEPPSCCGALYFRRRSKPP